MNTFVFAGETWPVCTVKIVGWDAPERTFFNLRCNRCDRFLGTFSQHESAMNWAQAHARTTVHLTAGGSSG